jgi:hypothetical protein
MAYIQLNDPETFIEFWENMASSIKLLNHTNEEPHYYAADIYELKDAFLHKIHSPAMISMCLSSNILDGKSHIQERVQCMLWIVAKEERNDDVAKQTVLNQCKDIVYHILGRLQKYKEEYELPGYEHRNCRIYQQSNVEPGWHGYALELPILVPVTSRISYDENNYN